VIARVGQTHMKTKAYKKRCKELSTEPYRQDEADRAGGLMKEAYVPVRRTEAADVAEMAM
jgi:hypothetical protein